MAVYQRHRLRLAKQICFIPKRCELEPPQVCLLARRMLVPCWVPSYHLLSSATAGFSLFCLSLERLWWECQALPRELELAGDQLIFLGAF